MAPPDSPSTSVSQDQSRRFAVPLRDLQIRNLRPAEKIYHCADEKGHYLEIRPNGSMLWRYKYRYFGKQKRLALGRYPEIGLPRHERAVYLRLLVVTFAKADVMRSPTCAVRDADQPQIRRSPGFPDWRVNRREGCVLRPGPRPDNASARARPKGSTECRSASHNRRA
ncbi:Arm DNA-binding domain-containing protein [Sphingobium aquiterrae]|uniref:Arm DNA-binding domain-containing protein n=1 Tax=Sphingobium aquiterrae TaxID=2038656 RepID=UPI003019C3A5